jgi:hypothetical protein
LQKQLNDLLFARAEPNGLFPHQVPPVLASPSAPKLWGGELFQIP